MEPRVSYRVRGYLPSEMYGKKVEGHEIENDPYRNHERLPIERPAVREGKGFDPLRSTKNSPSSDGEFFV